MTSITVKKRNGKTEPFLAEKINEQIDLACEGIDDVSSSSIALKAHIHLFDGITTAAIQESLISAALDLTTEFAPNYNLVAGRLKMNNIRKSVYGQFEPVPFYDHIYENIALGVYDKEILEKFTKEDIDFFEKHIDHDLDMLLPHPSVLTWEKKYLIKNRVTGVIYETPQFANMLISMCLFSIDGVKNRNEKIVKFYEKLANQRISLPSPIMGGVRSPTRQFSSCCLIDADDSLDSINAAGNSIVKYASKRAGIGINGGRIRAVGSPVRGGEIAHTGCINFYKKWQGDLHSCSQGGLRVAAATLYYPWWHYEIESLLVLKNNKGTESNRVRHMDYAIQLNSLLYERYIKGQEVTLFSPSANKALYEFFFSDQEKFKEVYERMETGRHAIMHKTIAAQELIHLAMSERAATGRIYIQNVDHCNNFGPFDQEIAPIYMSNLCVAPETLILTSNGYEVISELEGEEVDVWNGKEFSRTKVVKTGENQKLVKITTNAGFELECTPYHKFYVTVRDPKTLRTTIHEKRAYELVYGDKLIKSEFPVIEGYESLEYAYENGFFTGDGCHVKEKQRIYLYGEKRKLSSHFADIFDNWYIQENQDREYGESTKLKNKFFVPTNSYTIEARLSWLAGLCDADGTIARNGKTQSLQISSTNKIFLQEMQMMLQTLGVSSRINFAADEGIRQLPKNDGSGESGDFFCNKLYRLLVGQTGLSRLSELGFKPNRLELTDHQANRECTHFVQVISVEDEGRVDDTYCFTESKRHMGVFNGILTGQCLEIALPTKPMKNIFDKEDDGEIALCTLAASNLGVFNDHDHSHFEEDADLLVEALDNLLDYQDYPVYAAEKNKKRRTLGIGFINYSYWLAKHRARYSDGSGKNITHRLVEAFQYYLLKASNKLAIEKGACELFNQTKYAQGSMPIDRYKTDVDSLHSEPLHMDWDSLRESIKKYGLRNSTLTALMPSETSSIISSATNGIEPQRGAMSVKSSKDGSMKCIVPEYAKLRPYYEFVWDIPNNLGYLSLVAIMQKFVDQTISANTNYDPKKYPNELVPMKELVRDLFFSFKHGVKTLYYHNTRDNRGKSSEDEPLLVEEQQEDDGCSSGACKI